MSIANDTTISIPHHWSGEDALLVVGFLEEIARSICHLHGDAMMAAMRRRRAASGTVEYRPSSLQDELFSWTPPAHPDEV